MPRSLPSRCAGLAALLLAATLALGIVAFGAISTTPAVAQVQATPPGGGQGGGTTLEQAAEKAGDTARTVAISLLGVLLATPAGLNALNDLVAVLFGGR